MSREETSFESWEEVITDFLKSKRDTDEEKYLKDEIRKVEDLFSEADYFNDENIELIFNTRKNKKEQDESSLDFQQRRAITLFNLDEEKTPDDLNSFKLLKGYAIKRKLLSDKFFIKNWLSRNCKSASSVSFATHVIKLTHSKIDSPSILDSVNDVSDGYMTTSALANKRVDGAVAGSQFSPIFQFLELELNGVKLAEKLAKDEHFFDSLVKNYEEKDELLNSWTSGFRKAMDTGAPATHALAKQIFFPLNIENPEYHLLCNVVSSSIAHVIYEHVFDGRQKSIKKIYEKGKFHVNERAVFLQRSQVNVTASNHINASQLNAIRGGKLHLFSARPPIWQSQLKPPIYRQSLFSNMYNATIKTEIDYLRDFLLRFKQLDLSIKDPKRNRHLNRWVDNIIDEFLFYIASIENLPAGWSVTDGIKLKVEHQYLLDPYRSDESFQAARQNTDWQKVVRNDFSKWVNRQLRGRDNQFTPKLEHSQMWRRLLEQPLREHIEQTKQVLKHKERKVL